MDELRQRLDRLFARLGELECIADDVQSEIQVVKREIVGTRAVLKISATPPSAPAPSPPPANE